MSEEVRNQKSEVSSQKSVVSSQTSGSLRAPEGEESEAVLRSDIVEILGVKVNKVDLNLAVEQIKKWLEEKQKRTIFTPNVEFVMAAQKDQDFKSILNNSDLNIPDSSRFSWAIKVFTEKNLINKFLIWSTFLMPKIAIWKKVILIGEEVPVTTGVDLMEKLLQISNEKGLRIGLIGGSSKVADKLRDCLKNQYKDLKISYIDSEIKVDKRGEILSWKEKPKILQSNIEILFVAFGHIKQELFIDKNKEKIPAKIFIGIGGAFDYLSNSVPRAPKFIRDLGFEWLFRLINQPWRIKRFGALVKFVFLVLKS